ncbi:MAG: hypothetical protein IT445_01620 [Phycisphaeraceae bacterium]|nr:hypothetical protein [Phycisphaeraceae bacterium]
MTPRNDDRPLHRGLHAARQIAPAGAVLLTVAVSILLGYTYVTPVTHALDALAQVKLSFGLLFVVISTVIFGAIIPVVAQQSMSATRTVRAWRKMPYLLVFWAIKGIEVDLLYRGQAWLIGDNAQLMTIVIKVMIDQFVYCPVWALPTVVLYYTWLEGGCSFGRLRQMMGKGWYARLILPVLITNWFVWVPAVVVIYCLKLPLQLPIQNIILCLWAILLLVLVRQPVTRPSEVME